MVIIDSLNASIVFAQVFDTYKTSTGFDEFIAQPIPKGHIIVAACKDDCASNLSNQAKFWFANMGSVEIWNLKYRQGFTFIGKAGGYAASESKAKA